MLVKAILDATQTRLHDDGSVWPRAELLRWLNDGYRQLCAQSHAVVRPFQMDVPGRITWTGTQEWEDRHGRGTFARVGHRVESARLTVSSRWEAEFLEGLTPTASDELVTQPWERALSGETDHHFKFVLSKAHERPLKVYWDDKRLIGASTREMDLRDTQWWTESGEPLFWFPSVGGRGNAYEVYEVVTSYNQSYDLQDAENGIPREFSGDRTYEISNGLRTWDFAYSGTPNVGMASGLGYRFTRKVADDDLSDAVFLWEKQLLEGSALVDSDAIYTHAWEVEHDGEEIQLGVGLSRRISSADRQYMPAPYDTGEMQLLGATRDFKGSADALTVWEVIVPTRALTESDVPALIPLQFAKYLRFYVLSRAFSRKGEGMRPDLASHYANLYQLGVALLTKLGNPTFIDRVYGRESYAPADSPRPPRVRFPSTFERVW